MLSDEVNNTLTDISADSPAGKLLRHYWHPLCPAGSLSDVRRIDSVRILGEQVVVFRSNDGSCVAFPERCPHRGASLKYGFLEGDNLRCSYHGWLFGRDGICREMPFEQRKPVGNVRIQPYPIVERAGLLFIYMGPAETVCQFPEWDILNRDQGTYEIQLQENLACNWFQIQENAADVTHTVYLHARRFKELGLHDDSGFDRLLRAYRFQPFEYGIVKGWSYEDDSGREQKGWGNLLVFPNILRIETEMHWRVPVDKYTTRVFVLRFSPAFNDGCRTINIVKLPPRTNMNGEYLLDTFFSQDAMACETQGTVADRTREDLGASDAGIAMFRGMFLAQLERVQQGQDPNIARSCSDQIIDLREWMGGYLPMSAPPDTTTCKRRNEGEIFDHRNRRFIVP